MAVATQANEEFCAEPPRFAVWALYAMMVQGYLCAGLAALMLMGAVLAIALHAVALDWKDLLLIIVAGGLGIYTARGCRKVIHSAKHVSVRMNGNALRVTDTKGRTRILRFSEVAELRMSNSPRSHHLLLTPRVVIVTRAGEQIVLPMRLRDPAALVERLARVAGLRCQSRRRGWDVYLRPNSPV